MASCHQLPVVTIRDPPTTFRILNLLQKGAPFLKNKRFPVCILLLLFVKQKKRWDEPSLVCRKPTRFSGEIEQSEKGHESRIPKYIFFDRMTDGERCTYTWYSSKMVLILIYRSSSEYNNNYTTIRPFS